MANEITINASMTVRKLDANGVTLIDYNSRPSGYRDSMSGNLGGVPGAVVVPTTGLQITFTGLVRPTWCQITNLGRNDGAVTSASDYFEVGVYDPGTHKFYPLLEFPPGLSLPVKQSRNIQEIYLGPGTGTAAGGETARMMLLAHLASINAKVEAFEY